MTSGAVGTSGSGGQFESPGKIRPADRGGSPGGPHAPSRPLTSSGRFTELKLKGLLDRKGLWKSLNEMRMMLNFRMTPAAGEELGLGALTSSLRPQLS